MDCLAMARSYEGSEYKLDGKLDTDGTLDRDEPGLDPDNKKSLYRVTQKNLI